MDVVVVRDGPASERGWLALRVALGLGLGGREVTVALCGAGVAWAAAGLEARAWLGGDPAQELRGLLDDAGAAVLVEREALTGFEEVATGVGVVSHAELVAAMGEASLLVPV